MLVDVSELMGDEEFVRPIVLKRANPTTFAGEGQAVVTYQADRTISASVQPATPRELQFMPEGTRLGNVLSVWTSERVSPADGSTTNSDVLVIDGQPYKVIKANPWGENGYFQVFVEGYVP